MAVVVFPLEKSGQVALVVAPAVLSALSVVAVVLRIVARRMANRKLDWSDYTIIVACVFSVAFSGIIMSEGIVGGGGWHVAEITERFGPEPIVLFLKISVGVQILWTLSLSLCKISILLLYCRIFALPFFRGCCYATAGLIAAWSLSTILAALLICRPVSDLWAAVPEGRCGDHVLSYTITGAINIVTDVVVLLLPLPYLARLEMAVYKKVVLVATFTLGIFVCVISALRLHSIRTIDFEDITYSVAMAQVWSALEPALAITLACVPVLRPLFGGTHSATGTALGLGRRGHGPGGGRGQGCGRGYQGRDFSRPKSRRGLLLSSPSSSAPATATATATSAGTEEQQQQQQQQQKPPHQLAGTEQTTSRKWFQPRPNDVVVDDDDDDDDFELRDDDGAGSEYRLRPYYSTRHSNHVAVSTHSVEISTHHHATAETERRGRQRGARVHVPTAAGHSIDVRREWDINSEH